jgi:hypothetical protein
MAPLKNARHELTQERLRELLHYDPETGVFTALKDRFGLKAGSVAGTKHNNGYTQLDIDGRRYLTHRLAWFWTYGEWPKQIDHINRVRNDNRIANLRSVTQAVNALNGSIRSTNTSGAVGVSVRYNADGTPRWRAYINFNYRQHFIGQFKSKEGAILVRAVALKGIEKAHAAASQS